MVENEYGPMEYELGDRGRGYIWEAKMVVGLCTTAFSVSCRDIFVITADPLKEPPLVTANIVLFILAIDYPVDKHACYVSDHGATILTFEVCKIWVPFGMKYDIELKAMQKEIKLINFLEFSFLMWRVNG